VLPFDAMNFGSPAPVPMKAGVKILHKFVHADEFSHHSVRDDLNTHSFQDSDLTRHDPLREAEFGDPVDQDPSCFVQGLVE